MRAYTLLSKNIKEGKQSFSINEKPVFKDCGIMLDSSRNAVMLTQKVKEYLLYMASLGMNSFMLYTEDTYEIPEYPRMGYMRGRYSLSELKEIDDYANELGIEVIPCIQTLGHMMQFLQWNENSHITDTPDILLAGNEETYEFIEAAIRAMRSVFRSGKIHIGCDEAHTLGRGKYLDLHGNCNRFDILSSHIAKVGEICKRYNFKPLIWSDMYFRLRSEKDDYYDENLSPAEELDGKIPDVQLVYWDYYHTEPQDYERLFKEHFKLSDNISFTGGIWSWNGHLPWPGLTLDTSISALKEAAKAGVKSVTAAMWGDNGNECNHFMCIPLLPVYSELCYKGEECTIDDITGMAEFISGCPQEITEAYNAFSEYNADTWERNFTGKNILYANILLGLVNTQTPLYELAERFSEAHIILEKYKDYEYSEYASLLFKIISAKAKIMGEIRSNYKDKEYSRKLVHNTLPALCDDIKKLSDMHMELWHNTYKPFGYEVLNGRYGWICANLELAIYRLAEYIEGKCDCIEELETELIYGRRGTANTFKTAVTASYLG